VAARLQALCSSDDHRFWPASLSLRDSATFKLEVASHRHVTDVYLLALAVANGGALATFDRSIQPKAVAGATAANLEIIGG
jgi:predicted nucleic acid-binding protein